MTPSVPRTQLYTRMYRIVCWTVACVWLGRDTQSACGYHSPVFCFRSVWSRSRGHGMTPLMQNLFLPKSKRNTLPRVMTTTSLLASGRSRLPHRREGGHGATGGSTVEQRFLWQKGKKVVLSSLKQYVQKWDFLVFWGIGQPASRPMTPGVRQQNIPRARLSGYR